MNIRKRLFASLIMASCIAVTAMAQPKKMTVFFNNGNAAEATELSGIASLHFSDGNMLVKQKADWKEKAIALAEILSVKFTDADDLVAANELTKIIVTTTPDALYLIGYDSTQPQPAALYSLSGATVYSAAAQTSTSINISSLQKGIYILKLGNKSFKICK